MKLTQSKVPKEQIRCGYCNGSGLDAGDEFCKACRGTGIELLYHEDIDSAIWRFVSHTNNGRGGGIRTSKCRIKGFDIYYHSIVPGKSGYSLNNINGKILSKEDLIKKARIIIQDRFFK